MSLWHRSPATTTSPTTEHVTPLINLLNEQMLASDLIHMDETMVQVLKSAKAPSADHWIWVRARPAG